MSLRRRLIDLTCVVAMGVAALSAPQNAIAAAAPDPWCAGPPPGNQDENSSICGYYQQDWCQNNTPPGELYCITVHDYWICGANHDWELQPEAHEWGTCAYTTFDPDWETVCEVVWEFFGCHWDQ